MSSQLNYQKVHRDLLKGLPDRTRTVIERRFGLEKDQRETLESIGQSYGICRERVRQIEDMGVTFVKKEIKKPQYQKIFQNLESQLKKVGGLKREDLLVSQLTPEKLQNQTLFWLTLGDPFLRFSETKDLYPLWAISLDSLNSAQKVIGTFVNKFKKDKRLVSQTEVLKIFKKEFRGEKTNTQAVVSYLEVSKYIEQGPDGSYGLIEWPEIKPRGVKDKAYLALKEANKPLHFVEVAKAIDKINVASQGATLPQTVHNELIRDPRFILVGRGIYALNEWGYIPGQVRDIIVNVLKENKRPLAKEEIINKVLSQRLVKENTILLNLQNKDYFSKDSQGKYILKA